jgi:hypothetical protein
MKKTDLEAEKYEELSLLNKENHIFARVIQEDLAQGI